MAINQEALDAVLADLDDNLGLDGSVTDEDLSEDPPSPVLEAAPAPTAEVPAVPAVAPAAPADPLPATFSELTALLQREEAKRDATRQREAEISKVRAETTAETEARIRQQLVQELIRDPTGLARAAGIDPSLFAKRAALGALGDNAPAEFRQDVVNHQLELKLQALEARLEAQTTAAQRSAALAQRNRALESVPTRADTLPPAIAHLARVNPAWLTGELQRFADQRPDDTHEALVAALEERLAPLLATLTPIPAAPALPAAATAAPVGTPAAPPAKTAAPAVPVTSGGGGSPPPSPATSLEDRVKQRSDAAIRDLIRALPA